MFPARGQMQHGARTSVSDLEATRRDLVSCDPCRSPVRRRRTARSRPSRGPAARRWQRGTRETSSAWNSIWSIRGLPREQPERHYRSVHPHQDRQGPTWGAPGKTLAGLSNTQAGGHPLAIANPMVSARADLLAASSVRSRVTAVTRRGEPASGSAVGHWRGRRSQPDPRCART